MKPGCDRCSHLVCKEKFSDRHVADREKVPGLFSTLTKNKTIGNLFNTDKFHFGDYLMMTEMGYLNCEEMFATVRNLKKAAYRLREEEEKQFNRAKLLLIFGARE